MNDSAKELWLERDATSQNATRNVDGEERLKYDMEFIEKYVWGGGMY